MQIPKSLTPVLLFAILVHQIMSGPTEHARPDLMSSIVKSAVAEPYVASPSYVSSLPAPKTTNLKVLARNLDIHHVRNASHHLDDSANYYYDKQQSLIKALNSKSM